MSLAGVINSHTMAALIVLHHGTDEQRARLLPRLARGDARGGLCLTEPHAGSDVQAIRTVAQRVGDQYLISGSKMFVTNGGEGNTFALLARTDPAAQPAHRGMSCFIVEKGAPGLQVVKRIGKLGYKGVDTVEILFESFPVPVANLVGGVEGRGFKHVMSGLETGRINIAARAVGVAGAVLDETLRALPEGRERSTATLRMAAKVEAARLLTYWAGGMKDREERCDLEAGMAKLHASEIAQEVARDAVRLVGSRSQLLSGTLERHYRDTPLMIIGEGANEIQRQIIARQLLERYGERFGALTSRDGEPAERRQIVLAVRQFVEKDVVPLAQEHDGRGRVPARLRGRLAELGVFGALTPADQGGLELDLATAAMMIEEIARGWGSLALELSGHLAVTRVLASRAGGVERERRLPPMTRAEATGCPVTGAAIAAERSGDHWLLRGSAELVSGAGLAGVFVVEAGAASFAVPAGVPGLTVHPGEPTLGMRGCEPAAVRFDGVSVPDAARLAAGAAIEIEALTRLGAAAIAVGLAQAAFEAALRYSQQRTTFGKPICQHQAIQLKLADMATWTAAARLLTYRAAERLEARADDGDGARMAQLEAAETAAAVTLESMRIHGGYGYTTEFPVERYYRDAAALLALAGPTER
jgi:alkylation response protein AidB-like acyl-CoA dehydrogenase